MQASFGMWPPPSSGLSGYASVEVTPFNDEGHEDLPLAEFCGNPAEYRCNTCQAYINPYVGIHVTRWSCNFCGKGNLLPRWKTLRDELGQLAPASLNFASYEVNAEHISFYNSKWAYPRFILCINLHEKNTVLLDILDGIKAVLEEWSDEVRVCLVTYGEKAQVYALNHDRISVHVVNGAAFSPLPPSLCFHRVGDHREKLLELLDTLEPEETLRNSCNLATALSTCACLFEATGDKSGGKILCFNYGIPNDLQNLPLNSQTKEKRTNPFQPTNKTYAQLSQKFYVLNLTIDFFQFTDEFSNLQTITTIHETCGGRSFVYRDLSMFDVYNFNEELSRVLKNTKWNVHFALRASESFRVTRHFMSMGQPVGKFCNRTGSMQSSDRVTFGLEPRGTSEHKCQYFYVQFACACATLKGQFLRIHTLQIPKAIQISHVIENLNMSVILSNTIKICHALMKKNSLGDAQRAMQESVMEMCKEYFAVARNQLLPNHLMAWPDMVLASLKTAFGTDTYSEQRWEILAYLFSSNLEFLEKFFLPSLYVVSDCLDDPDLGVYSDDHNGVNFPQLLPLTGASMQKDLALLFDNGHEIIFWVGSQVSEDFMVECFGEGYDDRNLGLLAPDDSETSLVSRVNALVDACRDDSGVVKPSFSVVSELASRDNLTRFMFDDATPHVMSRKDFLQFLRQMCSKRD